MGASRTGWRGQGRLRRAVADSIQLPGGCRGLPGDEFFGAGEGSAVVSEAKCHPRYVPGAHEGVGWTC